MARWIEVFFFLEKPVGCTSWEKRSTTTNIFSFKSLGFHVIQIFMVNYIESSKQSIRALLPPTWWKYQSRSHVHLHRFSVFIRFSLLAGFEKLLLCEYFSREFTVLPRILCCSLVPFLLLTTTLVLSQACKVIVHLPPFPLCDLKETFFKYLPPYLPTCCCFWK